MTSQDNLICRLALGALIMVVLLLAVVTFATAYTIISPADTYCLSDDQGRFWVGQTYGESTSQLPGPPEGALGLLTWGHVHYTNLPRESPCYTRMFRGEGLLGSDLTAVFTLTVTSPSPFCGDTIVRGEIDYSTLEIRAWSGYRPISMFFTECAEHP